MKLFIPSVRSVTCVQPQRQDADDRQDAAITTFYREDRMTYHSPCLNPSLRERVRSIGGKIIARCPACAEVGADRRAEHLAVWPSGKFACAAKPGDRAHNQRIFALVGIAKNREVDGEEARIIRQRRLKEWHKARDEQRLINEARVHRDAIITRHEWKPEEVVRDSPQSTDSVVVESEPRHFLASLFPRDATIWTGNVYESGEGHALRWRMCGEWMAEPEDERIGPMVTPSTWIPGRSSRTRENILTRPYVVLDFDGMDGVRPKTGAEHQKLRRDSLALIRWLREMLHWQLAAILQTGGKSLHAWFHKPPQEILSTLRPLASTLGLDGGLIGSPEHPCRLPGQRHEKTGNHSSVLWLQSPIA